MRKKKVQPMLTFSESIAPMVDFVGGDSNSSGDDEDDKNKKNETAATSVNLEESGTSLADESAFSSSIISETNMNFGIRSKNAGAALASTALGTALDEQTRQLLPKCLNFDQKRGQFSVLSHAVVTFADNDEKFDDKGSEGEEEEGGDGDMEKLSWSVRSRRANSKFSLSSSATSSSLLSPRNKKAKQGGGDGLKAALGTMLSKSIFKLSKSQAEYRAQLTLDVGSSDGTICIYSLPQPQQGNNTNNSNSSGITTSTSPTGGAAGATPSEPVLGELMFRRRLRDIVDVRCIDVGRKALVTFRRIPKDFEFATSLELPREGKTTLRRRRSQHNSPDGQNNNQLLSAYLRGEVSSYLPPYCCCGSIGLRITFCNIFDSVDSDDDEDDKEEDEEQRTNGVTGRSIFSSAAKPRVRRPLEHFTSIDMRFTTSYDRDRWVLVVENYFLEKLKARLRRNPGSTAEQVKKFTRINAELLANRPSSKTIGNYIELFLAQGENGDAAAGSLDKDGKASLKDPSKPPSNGIIGIMFTENSTKYRKVSVNEKRGILLFEAADLSSKLRLVPSHELRLEELSIVVKDESWGSEFDLCKTTTNKSTGEVETHRIVLNAASFPRRLAWLAWFEYVLKKKCFYVQQAQDEAQRLRQAAMPDNGHDNEETEIVAFTTTKRSRKRGESKSPTDSPAQGKALSTDGGDGDPDAVPSMERISGAFMTSESIDTSGFLRDESAVLSIAPGDDTQGMNEEGDEDESNPLGLKSSRSRVAASETSTDDDDEHVIKVEDCDDRMEAADAKKKVERNEDDMGRQPHDDDNDVDVALALSDKAKLALEEDFGATVKEEDDGIFARLAGDEQGEKETRSMPREAPTAVTHDLDVHLGEKADATMGSDAEEGTRIRGLPSWKLVPPCRSSDSSAAGTNHPHQVITTGSSEAQQQQQQTISQRQRVELKTSTDSKSIQVQPCEQSISTIGKARTDMASSPPHDGRTRTAAAAAATTTDASSQTERENEMQLGAPSSSSFSAPRPPSLPPLFDPPQALFLDWVLLSHSSLAGKSPSDSAVYCRLLLLDSPGGDVRDEAVAAAARALGVDDKMDLVLLAADVRRVRVLRDVVSKRVACEITFHPYDKSQAARRVQSYILGGETKVTAAVDVLPCVSDARDLSQLLGEPLVFLASSDSGLETFLRAIVPYL